LTYVVNESCIRRKTMDCVEVCPSARHERSGAAEARMCRYLIGPLAIELAWLSKPHRIARPPRNTRQLPNTRTCFLRTSKSILSSAVSIGPCLPEEPPWRV
jgi:hypothetical protein